MSGLFRLIAVIHPKSSNDCCYRKQSLHLEFREGQPYTLELPVESDDQQVTALACAGLMLSTQSGQSPNAAVCQL